MNQEVGTMEYAEGREARRRNKTKEANPYKIIDDDGDIAFWQTRQKYHAWLSGWRSLSIM